MDCSSGLSDGPRLHLPGGFGTLPVGWSWARLADICHGIFDCPHSTPALTENGPLVVRSQDITNGVFRSENAAHVSDNTFRERTARATPSRGDLLYSREGTYFGIAAEVPPNTEVCLGQRMVLIRPRNDLLDFRFLRHWLNSPIMAAHIHGYRDGSVAERLNLPTIRSLPVALPPLSEQRQIAHILGALDNKIELKRRMNGTLEAIVRALFQSWFVDFDPVRAKAERRQTGLLPHLDALFPDSFEETDLGEIPRGWETVALSELASLNPETWSKETRPSVINYIDLSNTKWGRVETVAVYSYEDAPSRAQRILRSRDTIVGVVRPGNGSYAFVSDDGLTGSTGFAVLRPWKTEYAELVYLAATAAENIERLAHLADGAAYPAVRPEVVAWTRVVKPSAEIVDSFSRIAGPMLAKMAGNDRESGTLKLLRDTLLPKLVSGEIRVRNADSQIEANA